MKLAAIALAVGGAVALIVPAVAKSPAPAPVRAQRFEAQVINIREVSLQRTTHRATRARRLVPASRSFGPLFAGRVTWYRGRVGACGRALTGLYAASRTLPCGSHVRVSYGGRSVIVTILDRGPSWWDAGYLDLCPTAFSRLAPLWRGALRATWKLVTLESA
jgi:rare lipoprotein A (peptidoglycan hydrolase)